jgi:hypothetical protein
VADSDTNSRSHNDLGVHTGCTSATDVCTPEQPGERTGHVRPVAGVASVAE